MEGALLRHAAFLFRNEHLCNATPICKQSMVGNRVQIHDIALQTEWQRG